jgi:hypothetical protein
MKRRRAIIFAIALFAYLVSYAVFSVNGSYITANHGGQHWTKSWAPLYLVEAYRAPTGRQRTTLTIWGIAYLPCLFLDHMLWHRDQEPELRTSGA